MVLKAPKKHPIIPSEAKWLAGEGSGSWFHFHDEKESLRITRFSAEGNIECSGIFNASQPVVLQVPFEMNYPTHCQLINIIQQGTRVVFNRISD